MIDPSQLLSLEGQQYVVLRPVGAVADDYVRVQDALLHALPESVQHPHTGHVTLRAFFEPERLDEVREVIREWAAAQHPIEVVTEAIDTFPAPWQIVIARLARTPSLVSAYASLTAVLERTDLRRLEELSLDDWTFHLSVIYAKTLEADAWTALERVSRREYTDQPRETVLEAELVWYAGGVEHYEIIPFS